jgi:hypothetical protein
MARALTELELEKITYRVARQSRDGSNGIFARRIFRSNHSIDKAINLCLVRDFFVPLILHFISDYVPSIVQAARQTKV